MFKVNNKNTRTTPMTVNLEYISHLFLLFLLFTLNEKMLARKTKKTMDKISHPDILLKRCSGKFCKTQWKITVLESFLK